MPKNNKNISSNSRCKFCGKEKKLIKAHIIPRKFYIGLDNSDSYLGLQNGSTKYSIEQCGAYDQNILCSECDNNILGELDKEGYKVLLSNLNEYKIQYFYPNYKMYYLSEKDFDYIKLRKFFISILWRASISNLEGFSRICLGPYERKAYEILNGYNKYNDLFKILIYKSPDGNEINQLVTISKMKDKTCKTYYIVMAGYIICIIVNPRRLTSAFKMRYERYFLSPNNAYIIESPDVTRNIQWNFNRDMFNLYELGFKPPKPKNVD